MTIDHDRLVRFADEVVEQPVEFDEPGPGNREAAALLVLALGSINFGSGYHDVVRKPRGRSGARSMAAALRTYDAETGSLSPDRLCGLSPRDCARIFGQQLDGGPVEELMSLFSQALDGLGRWITQRGSAVAAIAGADRSAATLAEDLATMPFYRDVAELDGHRVAFYKRAQLTAADLERALGDLFDDLDHLTAFADNLVPHVLRVEGVLILDRDLEQAINAGRLLEPGGQSEIEFRAAGVHAVELLSGVTGRRAMDLDLDLWTMGGAPHYKAVRRHRARSVFY